jgi:hypothetical protein
MLLIASSGSLIKRMLLQRSENAVAGFLSRQPFKIPVKDSSGMCDLLSVSKVSGHYKMFFVITDYLVNGNTIPSI